MVASSILAHMIRKKLGAKGLSVSLCLGFGFEDLTTNALVGSAAWGSGHWEASPVKFLAATAVAAFVALAHSALMPMTIGLYQRSKI